MKPQTALFILFALLLTACGANAPQVTVTREAQVTVTLTPTATVTLTPTASATPIPATPEFDFSTIEGMKDLGDAWSYPSPDGTTITFSKGSVAMEGDVAIIGPWNLDTKTGELVFVGGSAAPKTVEEIEGFRKFEIIEGSPNEKAMLDTIHYAMREALKPRADYDPRSEFTGVTVDDNGKSVVITLDNIADHLEPRHWTDVDGGKGSMAVLEFRAQPQKHFSNFESGDSRSWFEKNPQARPIQVAVKCSGYFVTDVEGADGNIIKMLTIPVAIYDDGVVKSAVAMAPVDSLNQIVYGGEPKDGANGVKGIDLFTLENRDLLLPVVVYGAEFTKNVDGIESMQLSDKETREFMVRVNNDVYNRYPKSDTYSVYPKEISETVIYDLNSWWDK